MKILLVNDRMDFAGGAERCTVDVAVGLAERGHTVSIMFGIGGENSPAGKILSAAGVGMLYVKGLDIPEVTAAVGRLNPEVIYVQNINDPDLLLYLNGLKPTVRFIHDHRSYCPGNAKFWFKSKKVCPVRCSSLCALRAFNERCMTRRPQKMFGAINSRARMLRALNKLPKVICNSNYVRECLVQNGVDARKVAVNHLFPGGKKTMSEESVGETSKVPEILFVGRVFIEKGVDKLLQACAKIPGTNYRLNIVGEGWDLERVKDLALKLGLSERVSFPGFLPREKIDEYYRRCRFLALPSIWPEPFGMVGLEAYNFAKPVIAFDTGGVRDWLEDGKSGYLVEPGNISEMAQSMEKLLNDSGLAMRLGIYGKKLVDDNFNLDRHLTALLSAFRSLTVPSV